MSLVPVQSLVTFMVVHNKGGADAQSLDSPAPPPPASPLPIPTERRRLSTDLGRAISEHFEGTDRYAVQIVHKSLPRFSAALV